MNVNSSNIFSDAKTFIDFQNSNQNHQESRNTSEHISNIFYENNKHYSNNNNILVIENSNDTYLWKTDLISNAKFSIELTPNYCGGHFFKVVLAKIYTNMYANPLLKVHILLSDDFLDKELSSLLNNLQTIFHDRFNYLVTKKQFQTNLHYGTTENHEKMMIIDGKYVVLGGSGIKEEMCTVGNQPPANNPSSSFKDQFISQAYRDMDVMAEGDVVAVCREHFFDLYRQWENRIFSGAAASRFYETDSTLGYVCDKFNNHPEMVPNVKAKILVSDPSDLTFENPISKTIAKIIRKAKIDVKIAQMNFNPCNTIKESLTSLKNHTIDVNVSLISNSLTISSPFANNMFVHTNRSNYDLVDEVYEFQVPETLYHKKITTVDGYYTLIGSYNYSLKSAFLDNEIMLVIKSNKVTEKINRVLDEDRFLSNKLNSAEKEYMQSCSKTRIFKQIQTNTIACFF